MRRHAKSFGQAPRLTTPQKGRLAHLAKGSRPETRPKPSALDLAAMFAAQLELQSGETAADLQARHAAMSEEVKLQAENAAKSVVREMQSCSAMSAELQMMFCCMPA